jgi:hypothetical protein
MVAEPAKQGSRSKLPVPWTRDEDPLLAAVDDRLIAVKSLPRSWERNRTACLALLRSEPHRYRHEDLELCATVLSDALESPEEDRRAALIDALRMTRKTILTGTP